MIKRIFNSTTKTITSAAVIIGAASLTSRLLGVIRDRILAGEFGAGEVLDMYYAAFRIPDLVFNLLVLGTLSAGFIPIFINLIKKGDNNLAWQLVNNLLNLGLIILIGICGLFVLLAPYLMPLITPGFTPDKMALTVNLTRIMFLSPILLGISGILGGVLQSFKKFFIYSLAPIVYNIGIIIGALFFVPKFGIYGLAWGVVLGAFLHMLIQWPAVKLSGFKYQWLINWRDKETIKVMKMMIPRTLSLAISQINLVVITIIASTLAVGSIAIFNFANNLQSFPLGIFGISYAIAAFPALASLAARKEKQEFIKGLSGTFREIMFFIIPASVLLIVLRAQIVRVVLGSGLFNWEDTILTANTLAYFSISLFAQASLPLLARAFFAHHNSKTPFVIGLLATVVNIVLSLILAPKMGIAGLALAFSLSSIINIALLWFALRLELGNLDGKQIIFSGSKILIATLMLCLTTQAFKYIIEPYVNMNTFLGITIQGLTAGLVGIIVYFIMCLILRSPEMIVFKDSLKRKLFKQISTESIDESIQR